MLVNKPIKIEHVTNYSSWRYRGFYIYRRKLKIWQPRDEGFYNQYSIQADGEREKRTLSFRDSVKEIRSLTS